MSLNGIGGIGPGIIPDRGEAAKEVEPRSDAAQFQLEQGGYDAAGNAAHSGVDSSGVPEHAPAGADPEAWALLTDDERAFFQDPGLAGPVTYGRGAIDAALAALGGRLDVRG